jgi:hypothetical protein
MTDVPISTTPPTQSQPSAPDTTSRSTFETPVDVERVSSPNPIGPQAPQAPEKRTPSRMEAIQAAFDRANNPQKAKAPEKPQPKAAEAKAGHNQPPEETPKLNLRKPPPEQGQPQPRGERGQFAPRQTSTPNVEAPRQTGDTNVEAAKGTNGTQQPGSVRTLPDNAPFREPPPRMAEHAKRDWAAAPESVRGEIHRMNEEFSRAYQFYRADHEAFKPLRGFHQLAQSQGTTLDRALNNYVTMEQKLRSDLLGGLDLIVHNMGLKDPQTGRPLDLRDVAYTVLSQSPEQLAQMKQGNQQSAAAQQIGQLHQKIEMLENSQRQMHAERQFQYTRAQIDAFADDGKHPRFDELADAIKQEIALGFDLETAYRRAEMLLPADTHAAQTRSPSAQTRTTTDRSISGAPSDVTASNAASKRKQDPSGSVSEAVQKAFKAFGNGALHV